MLYSILNLAAFSPAIYWLFERNLPHLITLLLQAEADFDLEEKLRSPTTIEKPGSIEQASPSILTNFPKAFKDTKPALEPRTRSWKVPFKERNRLPDAVYKSGDVVWLTIDGEDGSFRVDIVTDGKWSETDQVWQYQVRQTDGELYNSGALVGESDLHRGKKKYADRMERGESWNTLVGGKPVVPDSPMSNNTEGLPGIEVQNATRTVLTLKAVEQCPEGYPRLAALLDSDENFMLYRRFGFLQSRLLLNSQDELRELEQHLDRMDKVDYKKDHTLLQSREKDDAATGRRKKLLLEIGEKFKNHGTVQLLNAARDLATYNRPSSRDYSSVKSYFDEEAPVCNTESYIYCREDLITLKPGRENAWLDAMVEKILQKSFVLLSIPVYILWNLTRAVNSGKTISIIIAVLLVSTLIFSAELTLFTRAKRHEILAAAAAYCAVLVVFVGNVGQISSAKDN
ncbi:hypothetical protein IFR05_002113 [Cadophora sp. M221]|nr:hypothetical protein IFR05_002113 [Cadophora sp. M221]